MATINNILGQADVVKHENKTIFDKTLAVTKDDGTSFSLSGYTGVFTIAEKQNGTVLYSIASGSDELTFSSNTFRINDKISFGEYFKLYFELTITSSTNSELVYVPWYGVWYNYYNT